MRDGVCSEQTMWERRTDVKGSGFWLTPTASDWKNMDTAKQPMLSAQVKMCKTPSAADAYTGNMKKEEFKFGNSGSLAQEVESGFLKTHRMWPTPQARDWRSGKRVNSSSPYRKLNEEVLMETGGQLNPEWVEWLMGWPIGWTDLKPLETDKYQQWLQQHGCC